MHNNSPDNPLSHSYSRTQLIVLVSLRLVIGWHFLYEGFVKLINPYWSSAAYLLESQGIFSSLFKSIAVSPTLLYVIDIINIWALIIIGFCLITGLFTNIATLSGAVLLLVYYICQPPFIGFIYSLPAEGNYLIVNKILIETVALLVLFYFPSSKEFGIEYFLSRKKISK